MKSLLTFVFLISSISVWAREHREELTINQSNGEEIDIHLVSYLNDQKTLEVRVEGGFFEKGFYGLNPVLAYGRDLDFNGKIDTWFILDIALGMKVIQAEGQESLGQDILGKKVLLDEDAESFYKRSVLAGISRHVFMAADSGIEAYHEYNRKLVDLEEFKIRLQQDASRKIPTLSPEQFEWSYYILSEGYKAAHEDLDKALGKNYAKLATADIVLWGVGGYFSKWGIAKLRSVSKYMTKALNKTSAFKTFTKYAQTKQNYLQKQKSFFVNKMNKVKGAKLLARVIMTRALLKSSLRAAMDSLAVKHKITHKVLSTIGKAGLAGMKNWKYVTLVGTASAISETYNNFDQIKDDDPTQTAKNIVNDHGIMNNVEYMTIQTFLSSSASTTVKSTMAQFGVCGVVALGHSGVRNILFADDPDYERIALDSGWEVIVGSTQTLVDLKAINYFEKLALKKKNPRLKLLGYAIVFMEQLVGSYVYSRMTSPSEENVTVVPVFAPN